jgi:hypothetical protein
VTNEEMETRVRVLEGLVQAVNNDLTEAETKIEGLRIENDCLRLRINELSFKIAEHIGPET